MIAVTFDGKDIVKGENATEMLRTMCDWFNPPTVQLLRRSFMGRAGLDFEQCCRLSTLSDHDFVLAMAEADIGFWSVIENSKGDFPLFA